jgi:hypothetical protein
MPQITKEDVCYLKHGERQIMARVFKPAPGSANTWRSAASSW